MKLGPQAESFIIEKTLILKSKLQYPKQFF